MLHVCICCVVCVQSALKSIMHSMTTMSCMATAYYKPTKHYANSFLINISLSKLNCANKHNVLQKIGILKNITIIKFYTFFVNAEALLLC